MIWGDGARYKG